MDLETFIGLLFNYVDSCGDLQIVLYAVITCVLTQLVKKIFVNKVKVDILHKFDFAVILPFVFGVGFALLNLAINKQFTDLAESLTRIIVDGATIGALATVIFRFVSSLSGQNLSSLLKDDVFGVFYNQILYFGKAREQLIAKELSLTEFIDEVKVIVADAKQIYGEQSANDAKRNKLAELLSGVVDEKSLTSCVNIIDDVLDRLTNFAEK